MRPKRCGTCSIRWDATGHVTRIPPRRCRANSPGIHAVPQGTLDGGRPCCRRAPAHEPGRTAKRYASCTDCEVNGSFPAASTPVPPRASRTPSGWPTKQASPIPTPKPCSRCPASTSKQLPAAREEALRLSAGRDPAHLPLAELWQRSHRHRTGRHTRQSSLPACLGRRRTVRQTTCPGPRENPAAATGRGYPRTARL